MCNFKPMENQDMTLEELNRLCRNTFVDHLGIRFTEFDGQQIAGIIEIKSVHLQPQGVVHGGLYISFAETLAGAGSALLLEGTNKIALGNTINSQHISPVRSGKITGVGKLIYQGITKHIWDVEIRDDSGKLISVSRVTNSIKELSQINDQGRESDD